mmetsp:Transcript_22974/g.58458  ORF Transcript_22974/g.58458 Transcript_22974/m.58458 type:complete len:601 (-) Transcript_22974:188-1990(-)
MTSNYPVNAPVEARQHNFAALTNALSGQAPLQADLAEPLARVSHTNSNMNSADSNGWAAFAMRPPPKAGRCSSSLRPGCLGVMTVFFAAVAILGPLYAQLMLSNQLDQQLIVDSPEADGYDRWYNATLDSDREVHMYIFEVQNPDGFINGDKLEVAERGPFVYRKTWIKWNATFNESDNTVDYRSWVRTDFDPERTKALTNAQYDSDDVAFLVVDAFFWGELPQMGPKVWKVSHRQKNDTERMFTRLKVRDLKNGYGACPLCFPGLFPNQDRPEYGAIFRMRTGKDDSDKATELVEWKGEESMTIECPWGQPPVYYCPDGNQTSPCCGGTSHVWGQPPAGSVPEVGDPNDPNRVAGTDGNQFARAPLRWWTPLPPEPLDYVVVFVDLISRHLPMSPRVGAETFMFDGLELTRYEVPLDSPSAGNADEWPYNAAYYMFAPRNIINITMIQLGAPIFMTNPHFLGVGDEAARRVIGMHPDAATHQTLLGVERTSGLNIYSRQRMQVNVEVKEVRFADNSTWFSGIMPGATYAPLAWFDIVETATPDQTQTLRKGLQLSSTVWYASLAAGASLSLICAVAAIVLVCRARRRAKAEPTTYASFN